MKTKDYLIKDSYSLSSLGVYMTLENHIFVIILGVDYDHTTQIYRLILTYTLNHIRPSFHIKKKNTSAKRCYLPSIIQDKVFVCLTSYDLYFFKFSPK